MDRRTFLKAAAAFLTLTALTGCDSKRAQDADAVQESEPALQLEPDLSGEEPFSLAMRLSNMTDVQRNSINMLNYLTVLMENTSRSENGRLLAEDVYDGLINNIAPNAVDSATLYKLEDILDMLEQYRMVQVKRERLLYLYEQAKAQSITSAVPNPLGLLSTVQSMNLASIAVSVAWMAVDAYSSYSSAMSAAESEYLRSGWDLDDEEAELLHSSRKGMFSYMVETVGGYGLPGDLALTEKAADDYALWSEEENVSSRMRFLESSADIYCGLGAYWLTLACGYSERSEWEKCIQAVRTYEKLSTGILRRDRDYARTLPLAIAAASELGFDGCGAVIAEWARAISDNCGSHDGVLRYFAAQALVGASAQTGERVYLEEAWEVALDNANALLFAQRNANAAYLAPVAKEAAAEGSSKAHKTEVDNYNRMLEAERKIALPPVDLVLAENLELLCALADELGLDDNERAAADEILHGGGKIFLAEGIESLLSLSKGVGTLDADGIGFDHAEVRVPASLVCSSSKVSTLLPGGGSDGLTFDDWVLDRVDRGTEGELSTFVAVYISKTAENTAWEDGMEVVVLVDPFPGHGSAPIERTFRAVFNKDGLAVLAFWDDGIRFEAE